MHRVPGEHTAQVSLAEDQHPVGDFGAEGQDKALGEAVRPRAAGRDLDHLDTGVCQDRVEQRRELPGAIAKEEPEPGTTRAVPNGESNAHIPQPVGCQNSATAPDQRFQAAAS
jgi:hypothetical protein